MKDKNDKARINSRRNSTNTASIANRSATEALDKPLQSRYVSEELEYREYGYFRANGEYVFKGLSNRQPKTQTITKQGNGALQRCVKPSTEMTVKLTKQAAIVPKADIGKRCDDNSKALQSSGKRRHNIPDECLHYEIACINPKCRIHKRQEAEVISDARPIFAIERKPRTSSLEDRISSYASMQSNRKVFGLQISLKHLVTASLKTGR